MMKQRILTVAVATLLLGGCGSLLTPKYEQPEAPVPQQWPMGAAYDKAVSAATSAAIDMGWRSFIADARLQKLVELALANNRSLRVSALNIEKARAAYGISRADMFPSIEATGTATHKQSARDVVGESSSRISHNYAATVGFSSYELDFFGKIQNQASAAREAWLQLVETRDAAQISLIAEVASAYLNLAADQQRLQLAQETFKSQQETLRLTLKRHALKVDSLLDVTSVQASVQSARADIATYTTTVAQDENALAVLIGTSVPADLKPPVGLLEDGAILHEVPTGLKSDVLLRRPDLRADEHALKAANADIGAARAAFFPSITLTGNIGTASTQLGRLFNGGNRTWSFIPSINVPIFEAGRLSAELDEAKVARDIQIATYEGDIQTAFKEVANALAQRGTIDETLSAEKAQAEAYAKSYDLAQKRYKNGIDSYLSMLVYQRSHYSAQQSLVSARLTEQTNLVTLYKVLGGGVKE